METRKIPFFRELQDSCFELFVQERHVTKRVFWL